MLAREWQYSGDWVKERSQLLRQLGCRALALPEVQQIGISVLCGPLAGFCPVACNCSTTKLQEAKWFCPAQCTNPMVQLAPP